VGRGGERGIGGPRCVVGLGSVATDGDDAGAEPSVGSQHAMITMTTDARRRDQFAAAPRLGFFIWLLRKVVSE
jgi:hypothetical protein